MPFWRYDERSLFSKVSDTQDKVLEMDNDSLIIYYGGYATYESDPNFEPEKKSLILRADPVPRHPNLYRSGAAAHMVGYYTSPDATLNLNRALFHIISSSRQDVVFVLDCPHASSIKVSGGAGLPASGSTEVLLRPIPGSHDLFFTRSLTETLSKALADQPFTISQLYTALLHTYVRRGVAKPLPVHSELLDRRIQQGSIIIEQCWLT